MNNTTKNATRVRTDDGDGESLVVDHSQGHWGAIPDALLEDTRLSLSTRPVAAWICGRPPGWTFRRWHMLKTLGVKLDAWWNMRRQLIEVGYLVAYQPRASAGRFHKMVLRFDPAGGLASRVAARAQAEDVTTVQGFTVHGATEHGATEHGKTLRYTKPSLNTPSSSRPPPPTRARTRSGAAAAAGGGQGVEQEQEQEVQQCGLSAIAPAGASRPARELGLGEMLADLLTPAERLRVDRAGVGAAQVQLEIAVAAMRAAVRSGSARSTAALAVRLAGLAARGELTPPAPARSGAAPGQEAASPSPWPEREARSGWWVAHPMGELVVEPGARGWRYRGGKSAGLIVAGVSAQKVWSRVESGELQLQPPTP